LVTSRGEYIWIGWYDLDEMTVEEKLEVMEQLWQDLSRNAEDVPSPAWHAEVLAERERLVQEGKDKYSPLEEVMERIKRKIG
jgi:putative addiction module component (TIGR02574 family)